VKILVDKPKRFRLRFCARLYLCFYLHAPR
jgi:hypothetical protein